MSLKTSDFLNNGYFLKKPMCINLIKKCKYIDDIISYKSSNIFVIFDGNLKLEFGFNNDVNSYFSIEPYGYNYEKKIIFDDANIFNKDINYIKNYLKLVRYDSERYGYGDNILIYVSEGEICSVFQTFE